jgi:hypothetical protein
MPKLSLVLVALLLFSALIPTAFAAAPAPAAFPLAKGAFWVYEGPVTWTPDGADKPQEKVMTWKMEITDVIERDWVQAAVVKGHPMDLAFYEEGRKPDDYLLVSVRGQQYYLVAGDAVADALKKLKDAEDPLTDLVKDTDLILDLPLTPGKAFGETAQITRPDNMYVWVVGAEQKAQLSKVKGAPAAALTESELTFTTLSDNATVKFVPGVGITAYEWNHHGTVSTVDVKLIEYHAGGGIKS